MEFVPGFPRDAQPGDYCRVPAGIDPRPDCDWYVLDPTGGAGAILNTLHAVAERGDGAITVSPSVVMFSGWHGWLAHGVWRSV